MARVLEYMTKPESWKGWRNGKKSPHQGVVKWDWVPTGRIDFAAELSDKPKEVDQPSEFKLLVEERRIVESIAGNEHLEIQWRLADISLRRHITSDRVGVTIGNGKKFS